MIKIIPKENYSNIFTGKGNIFYKIQQHLFVLQIQLRLLLEICFVKTYTTVILISFCI